MTPALVTAGVSVDNRSPRKGLSIFQIHQPAATVTGALQPKGRRPGADSGDPRAGDVIVQPRGWSGRWDVTETTRKVYSIGVPATEH